MKMVSLTLIRENESSVLMASCEESILKAIQKTGSKEPDAPCGGNGTCRKCLVTVTGPVRSIETGVTEEVNGKELLACRYCPAGDLEVTVRKLSKMNVATEGAADLEAGGEGLGIAVDIGTTTVAAFLYDLQTGKCLARQGDRNAQRTFGADVISRISCCKEGNQEGLVKAIRNQLTELTARMCGETGEKISAVRRFSIAGNTVMEHLFDDLSPVAIGVAPFTPESLFGDHRESAHCFEALKTKADVYLCPCVAGYVGGDITAGLLASGAMEAEGLRLYIDIGTNGEMGIGNKEGFVTCATAAGPAFEGAEISCGMDGSPGAVDKVKAVNGDVEVHVIGDAKAKGICGSGLIDAIAAMLELEVLSPAGRIAPPEELPEKLAARIFRTESGQFAFRLIEDVYVTAQDVREVQLAKAAIRAGAETLLQLQGKKASDITELVIAGGFGSYMDKISALRIGLLPEVDPGKISHVGNAAGAGAALALTDTGERRLAELTQKCSYLELSSSREFMDNYVEFMAFD